MKTTEELLTENNFFITLLMFTDPVSDQQKRRVEQLNISGKGGN